MTSTRPYLLRAIYEWIVDNNLTPHLLVETNDSRVQVPNDYVENNTIVLNVAPGAVRDLELANEHVSFSARFSGTPYQIFVPLEAVQAIYARENGQGIFLGEGDSSTPDGDGDDTASTPDEQQSAASRAPHLTVVK